MENQQNKKVEKEFLISYKDGGSDLDEIVFAKDKEEALSKFYEMMNYDSDIWDVVCW